MAFAVADPSGTFCRCQGSPSTSASSCSIVSVSVPLTSLGQANLPLLSRRAASHTPMPSCTSTFMRLARRLAGVGGRYFEDCEEAPVVDRRPADFTGVAPYALDAAALRLWELASALIGLPV